MGSEMKILVEIVLLFEKVCVWSMLAERTSGHVCRLMVLVIQCDGT